MSILITACLDLISLGLLIGILAGLFASSLRVRGAASGGRLAPDQPGGPAGYRNPFTLWWRLWRPLTYG